MQDPVDNSTWYWRIILDSSIIIIIINTIIIIITLPRDNNFQVLNLLLGQTFPWW